MIFQERWKTIKKCGAGAFGEIYKGKYYSRHKTKLCGLATDLQTNEDVAIKLEPVKTKFP
jgi:hypothetical protein